MAPYGQIEMSNVSALEESVRSCLRGRGVNFEANCREIFGTPDIVIREAKTVIFVDGCFWHRHIGCPGSRLPKTNTLSWLVRGNQTASRDEVVTEALLSQGWKVLRFWECEIRSNVGDFSTRLNDFLG